MTIELHDYGLFCEVISPDAAAVFQPSMWGLHELLLLTELCVIDSKPECSRFVKRP